VVDDERVEELRRYAAANRHLRSKPPAEPQARAPIVCPFCGATMQVGVASIHGTLLGFLVIGFSHQSLWFRPDGARKEVEALVPRVDCPAQSCGRCGAVLLGGPRR
jgi:hypothetical protein